MCHVLRNIQKNIQIKVSFLAVGLIYKQQASSSINFHSDVHFNFCSKCNKRWKFKCSVTHLIKVVKNEVGHKNAAWGGNSLPYIWHAGCAMF